MDHGGVALEAQAATWPDRAILHVDMDAFFAAIAERDDPSLRGHPVLIGSRSPRAVVATANYLARQYGCHSAMPMAVALRRCPQARVVQVPGERIRTASRQVFSLFQQVTSLLEPLSVDEAFLDVTGSRRLIGAPEVIARQLKDRIAATTGLTASVGVAPNKFLAKLASDMDKPDGLTVIRPEQVQAVLDPLPLRRIPGIGPAAEARLAGMGLRSIGQLRQWEVRSLVGMLGDYGLQLHQLAQGIDPRPVVPDHVAQSIGHEQTFPEDVADSRQVQAVLLGQVEQVAWRLRRRGVYAQAVTLKIRFGDFQTITRRSTLAEPAQATGALWRVARELFEAWVAGGFRPVRLIGVAAGPLTDRPGRVPGQAELFADPVAEKQGRLDAALDALAERFGRGVVRRAGAAGAMRPPTD